MEGTTVGNWRLQRKIGTGGMGAVYMARHLALDTLAAVKALAAELVHDPEFCGRFCQEARTQSRLHHPHVIPVYDYQEQDGRWFLITEYAEQGGLDRLLAEAPETVDVDQAVTWALQALDALDYAHREGVIHRDVKPSNIMLDAHRRVKMTDFGIAVVVGGRRLTRTGVSLGTPHYMSPEQIRRPHEVDHRTDVYSLGLVLYELLTGKPPFDADSEYDVQHAQVHQPPVPPRTLNRRVSEALEELVLTALAKDPNDRFVGCGAFARALEQCRNGGGSVAVGMAPSAPALEAELKQSKAHATVLDSRLRAIEVALLIAAILAVSGFGLAQSRGNEVRDLRETLSETRVQLADSQSELEQSQKSLAEATSRQTTLRRLFTARSWPIDVADGFTDNRAGWELRTFDDEFSIGSWSLADRVLYWQATARTGFVSFISMPAVTGVDVYAAVDASPQSCNSCSYGWAFRVTGRDKYLFRVQGKQAMVEVFQDEAWHTLHSRSDVPNLVASGPNRLEMITEQDRFSFFINGEPWLELSDSKLTSGFVMLVGGISTSGHWGRIRFDNVEVRRKPAA